MNSGPGRRILQNSQKALRWRRNTSFFLYSLVIVPGLSFARSFAQAADDPLNSAASQVRAGLYDRAIGTASAGLRSHPTDYRLMTVEGLAYSLKHDDPNALRLFRSALRISPNYLPALQAEAEILTREQSPSASDVLTKLVTLRPSDTTAREMLALAQAQRGNCPAAISNFRLAASAMATHADSLLHYAACLFEQSGAEAALPFFQALIDLRPTSPDARYDLALTQLRTGRNQDAIATLQPLLDSTPDVDTLTLASDAYEAAGDTPHSVALLRQAIVRDPNRGDSYARFAELCLLHRSYDTGIAMMTAGISHLPRDPELYLARGLLYGELAQYDKAEADFRAAESFDRKHGTGSYGVGLMQVQSGHFDQALSTVRSELRGHPADAQLHFLLARILIESGATPETAQFTEAKESALQAIRARPAMIAAHDLLADIYMRTGETELAVAQCRAVLAIDPSESSAMYRLMIASRKMGDKTTVQELAKRLAELHQQARADESNRLRYRIVEGDSGSDMTVPAADKRQP
jgi:tetratricopeptide (TPR) repeat protein